MTAGDLTLSVYPEGRGRSRHGTESRPLDGGGVSGGVERAQHVVTHGRVDEPPARRGEWVVMKVVGHQRRRRWVWSAARAADALRLVAVVRRRAPRFACCRSWSHRARRQRGRRRAVGAAAAIGCVGLDTIEGCAPRFAVPRRQSRRNIVVASCCGVDALVAVGAGWLRAGVRWRAPVEARRHIYIVRIFVSRSLWSTSEGAGEAL